MLGWIVAGCIACMVVERAWPGWRLPQVKCWWARTSALALAQVVIALAAGCYWNFYFHGEALFALSDALPAWAAAAVAYLAATFVFYWWHRARHASDFLWRTLHQVHHSAERLEAATAFYKHPLEMLLDCALGGALAYAVLGLDPEAGMFYAMLSVLAELVYHANWRSPRWLGFAFQRPEMHRVHHERDRHRCNYADLPLWDLAFGTWHNPAVWDGQCGFDPARADELPGMLAFADVHRRGSLR